jgi:predicted transcriptional regulator
MTDKVVDLTFKLQVSEETAERLETRARERGFLTVDEYMQAVLEADSFDVYYETPDDEIIEGLREGLRDIKEGNVYPTSELWDNLDDDE